VGTHGIRILFVDARGRERSATFLPEVAAEQGWDRMQTLEALVRKSGCREAVTEELLAQVKLTRYKSSKSSLTWHEYDSRRIL
jgi:AMMECR1 domain-containing protein